MAPSLIWTRARRAFRGRLVTDFVEMLRREAGEQPGRLARSPEGAASARAGDPGGAVLLR